MLTNRSTTTINGTAIIYASKLKVWKVLEKPDNIHLFHPLIKNSLMIPAGESESATVRKCILKPMGEMTERITHWEEGSSYVTEVIGGKMLPPFEFMRGKIKLKSLSESETEAIFTFQYKLKYGLFGQVLNTLFVKPQFKGAPVKYVKGLKMYVEDL